MPPMQLALSFFFFCKEVFWVKKKKRIFNKKSLFSMEERKIVDIKSNMVIKKRERLFDLVKKIFFERSWTQT